MWYNVAWDWLLSLFGAYLVDDLVTHPVDDAKHDPESSNESEDSCDVC